MDGGDGRALDVGGRGEEALAFGVGSGRLEGLLDLLAQAQLQLPCRLLGEGDGHDAVEGGAAGAEEGQDAADEHGGLAGAGAGFEQEGGVEVAEDAVADGLVGGWAGHEDLDPPCPSRSITSLAWGRGKRSGKQGQDRRTCALGT